MARTTFAATLVVLGLVAVANAQNPNMRTGDQPGKMSAGKSYPSSKLVGLTVKNTQGEDVGTINDLVISVADGKVAYAALSHGGVLGIGDKLFAVPFRELKFTHDKADNEMHFVLNISNEKLKAAPGFDKNNWPDFANEQWRQDVDRYYRQEQATERTGQRQDSTVRP